MGVEKDVKHTERRGGVRKRERERERERVDPEAQTLKAKRRLEWLEQNGCTN